MNSTTLYPVQWTASLHWITVRCNADPATVTKLVKGMSRLLQKAGVSGANISVSGGIESSEAGGASTAV